MNQKQIRAAVEAMLFASGDPIGADKLAQAVQLPQLSVEAALEALRERYAREDSGLCLLHLNTRWPTTCTMRRRCWRITGPFFPAAPSCAGSLPSSSSSRWSQRPWCR